MINKPAGFLLRLQAEVTEFFLFGLIFTLILSVLINAKTLADFCYGLVVSLITIILPLFILMIFYRPLFIHYFGGNIGKLLTGIRVKNFSEDTNLSFKTALFRSTVGYSFSWILFGLGFWTIIKDKDKLAFHDKMVNSKVIIIKKLWPFGLTILTLLLIIHISLLNQTATKFVNSPLRSELGFLLLNLDQQIQNSQTNLASSSAIPK